MTNSTTDTLMTTMVALNRALSLMPTTDRKSTRLSFRSAPVRAPVRAIDIVRAQSDDEQYHRYLNDDDGGVEPRTLFDAHHQNRRNHQRDQECGKVQPDFRSKQVRRTQQIVRPLQQFWRLSGDDRIGRASCRER